MPVEVILPKVDMDMAVGKISKWHVKEGDQVAKGDVLFEIETDKAAMEVDAPGGGIIRQISAKEGAVVPVGSAVAFIYDQDEAIEASAAETARTPISMTGLAPSRALNAPEAPPDKSAKPRATPLAKRLARGIGVALEGIIGSGPRGRIVAADIERFVAASRAATAELPSAKAPASGSVHNLYVEGSYDILPIDGMRRTIAERLTLSKQTIPHFYLTVTCDVGQLMDIRERINAQVPRGKDGQPQWKLSVNDFIIKALALALQRVPRANATWTDDGLLLHKTSDIGVAVAVENGLFTPVVRAAESKTLSQISGEMKDLAARARARKLAPADYQGGTTAISNLGMYGIEQFTAIINPPHATILAVGAAHECFVPVEGRPVLRHQLTCTLSCDHRAVDGALGAQLLAAFRSYIEEPALMLA
jgi:pyruvate dehydrogenase E2 component (dihydrolipoamide acetyltransferase)